MLISNSSNSSTIISSFLFSIMVFLTACKQDDHSSSNALFKRKPIVSNKQVEPCDSFAIIYEKNLQDAGLVNCKNLDSTIVIDIKYATNDNFMHINLYHGCQLCYMHQETARKLKQAQMEIKANHPGFRLIIFDATRPCCVQQFMWDSAKMNLEDKRKFLANPNHHSLHNYGLAIDCGLIDGSGALLDMGTKYDYAGEKAYPCLEKELLEKAILTKQQVYNRNILRSAMQNAGFTINPFEWWHFNTCSRSFAERLAVRIVDFRTFVRPLTVLNDEPALQTAIMYKVQIATSPRIIEKNDKQFKGLPVEYYKQDNCYKYTVGKCTNYKAAFNLRDSVAKRGYPEAFVVCFKGTKRVSVKDVLP